MHIIIKSFLTKNNFVVKNDVAYGSYRNFDVNVQVIGGSIKLFVSTYASDELKGKAISDIVNKKLPLKIKLFATNHGLVANYSIVFVNQFNKTLYNFLDAIIDSMISIGGFLNNEYDPYNGAKLEEGNSKVYDSEDIVLRVTNETYDILNQSHNEVVNNFKNLPNNYLKGFLGAALGALIGAVLEVILFYIGFVSAYIPLLSVYLGLKFYIKFGGKPTAMMSVIVILTTVFFLFGAYFIVYLYAANGLCMQEGLDIAGIEAFKYQMNTNAAYSKEFNFNLLLLTVFTIIGLVFSIYECNKVKKLNEVR